MSEYPVLGTGMNGILIVPSSLVGEREGEIGDNSHPLLSPPPSRGRGLFWDVRTGVGRSLNPVHPVILSKNNSVLFVDVIIHKEAPSVRAEP